MIAVVDFGVSTCSKAVGILERLLGTIESVAIVRSGGHQEIEYEDVEWEAEQLREALDGGELHSVSISGGEQKMLALIVPLAEGGEGGCLVSIDWDLPASDTVSFLQRLESAPSCTVYARGWFDSVLLDVDPLPKEFDSQNFPWNHWSLVDGAVRRANGSWDYRRGPSWKDWLSAQGTGALGNPLDEGPASR